MPRNDDRPTFPTRYAVAGVLILLVLVGVVFVPGWLVSLDLDGQPVTATERITAVNNARMTLLQAVGGVALGLGVYATWRRVRINEEELRTSRDGQITERYSRAVDHLGSSSMDVRMGGVHALARLAHNSPDDRDTVVAVLCAFIRGHSPWPPTRPEQAPADTAIDEVVSLAIRSNDVQAALTALGRFADSRGAERIAIPRVDLRHARFDGLAMDLVNLGYANLARARLRGTTLRGATLRGTDLRRADLREADLREADLCGADLCEADLRQADLRDAMLDGARLTGARADPQTRWPEPIDPVAEGVIVDRA